MVVWVTLVGINKTKEKKKIVVSGCKLNDNMIKMYKVKRSENLSKNSKYKCVEMKRHCLDVFANG